WQARGEPGDVEYRVVRPDGSVRWVRDRSFPVQDAAGRVYRVAGIAEDITERRRLEEHSRQSQKMEAIGQLAGGAAHDFNNLLWVMIGYTELMLKAVRPDDPMRELLQQTQKAGEQAASLTQQLLAFSRKQVVAPRVLDLNAVVTDLSKMLCRVI